MTESGAGPPWDLGDGARLRLLTLADADEMFALVDANRARLEPWMPWTPHVRGPADSRANIQETLAGPSPLDACGVEVEGALVGRAGLRMPRWDGDGGEIGYWIDGAHEGRGLVTRAARVLLDHAFGPLGLEEVTITVEAENARSRAVAERLGFTDERREVRKRGEDDVVYLFLASAWRPGGDER